MTESILGIPICTASLRETVDAIVGWLDVSDKVRYFACVNPHSVMQSKRDEAFNDSLQHADLNTADGTGIVVASRLRGGAIKERVCGPDLFPMICEKLNKERPGTRMFFLGATTETLEALVKKFNQVYPQLIVAGTLAPPFKATFSNEEEQTMCAQINSTQAEILWLGLGAPKQEKWAYRNQHRLQVKIIGPVGGVFDFFTGRVKLPPPWAQKLGLIWLFRLCQQPGRLWRRNLDGPLFLIRSLME